MFRSIALTAAIALFPLAAVSEQVKTVRGTWACPSVASTEAVANATALGAKYVRAEEIRLGCLMLPAGTTVEVDGADVRTLGATRVGIDNSQVDSTQGAEVAWVWPTHAFGADWTRRKH
jgi:hypothetical protein